MCHYFKMSENKYAYDYDYRITNEDFMDDEPFSIAEDVFYDDGIIMNFFIDLECNKKKPTGKQGYLLYAETKYIRAELQLYHTKYSLNNDSLPSFRKAVRAIIEHVSFDMRNAIIIALRAANIALRTVCYQFFDTFIPFKNAHMDFKKALAAFDTLYYVKVHTYGIYVVAHEAHRTSKAFDTICTCIDAFEKALIAKSVAELATCPAELVAEANAKLTSQTFKKTAEELPSDFAAIWEIFTTIEQ